MFEIMAFHVLALSEIKRAYNLTESADMTLTREHGIRKDDETQ